MTAIGFAMFAVGYVLAHASEGKSVTAGMLIIVGIFSFVVGISTFLWRLMP